MRIFKSAGVSFGLNLVLLCAPAADFARSYGEHPAYINDKTMKETKAATKKRPKFYKVLNKILSERGLEEKNVCDETNAVQLRILNEYGAVFVVGAGVVPPPMCVFADARQVDAFQQRIFKAGAEIGEARVELQTVAMQQLLKAREKAAGGGVSITPRGGSEAARRDYADTLRLWKSRFEPACAHWLKAGRLTAGQVENLKSLPISEQVREVLNLEKLGIFFNTRFDDSILYSVAAPGTSQHLSMLALDVREFADERVRKILAKHGWFRTVQNDTPHFTFLGRRESELKKLGLKKIETDNGEFWIPNVD